MDRFQRAVLMLGSVTLLTNCKIRFLFVCFCSFATFTSFIVMWGKQHPRERICYVSVVLLLDTGLTLPGSFSFLYLKCYFSV